MLEKSSRDYFEQFDGQGQQEAGYAGPDFTITGGGATTNCPYPTSNEHVTLFPTPFLELPSPTLPADDLTDECRGAGNDPGGVEPIVLMVHRNGMKPCCGDDGEGVNYSRDVVLSLHGTADSPSDPGGGMLELTCVYRNFACGPMRTLSTEEPGGRLCETSGVAGGDFYTAYRYGRGCPLPDESNPGTKCLYVYIDHHVNDYPDPMSYFVTHSCTTTFTGGLAITGKQAAGLEELEYRGFLDFVHYMTTEGLPTEITTVSAGDLTRRVAYLQMRLPTESGTSRPGDRIEFGGQTDIHIPSSSFRPAWDVHAPIYSMLDPVPRGGVMAGDLAVPGPNGVGMVIQGAGGRTDWVTPSHGDGTCLCGARY
jgi:hypothetical protein